MAIRFTAGRFPKDPSLKDSCGIPWGCVVQPFFLEEGNTLSSAPLTRAELIARCNDCYGYINGFCEIRKKSWRCALCDSDNTFTNEQLKRYGSQTLLTQCEEINSAVVEFDVAADDEGGQDEDIYTRPVYIAAVDLSASEEFLELVKSALLAALEALSPAALFGLVTYGRKIGLYDLQGVVPVVKQVAIPPGSDSELLLDLRDVLPLEALLTPVDTCKEQIAAALETLHPASTWDAGQGEGGESSGGRGFGTAMTALLQYLGAEQGSTFVSARLFSFLSGPPDFGAGQIDRLRLANALTSKGEEIDAAVKPEQEIFYKDLAALAVQAGVCVDLFAISGEHLDLASLKHLSTQSGGGVYLYQNAEEATLPQDIYRMLTRPHAFGGVLRLRTSSEFQIAQAYGHFFPDAQYENLYHIISCDPFETYGFDFEFSGSSGFGSSTDLAPTVQMAFQYTVLLPAEDNPPLPSNSVSTPTASDTPTANGHTPTARRWRYLLRRRLRLRSTKVHIAQSASDIYDATDCETVLYTLTHKIVEASLQEGLKEARLLLQDWIVILTAQYNDFFKIARFSDKSANAGSNLDVSFAQCPALQPIPRLVFALLRSPLLRLQEEGIHPDVRTHLQVLYGGLDPSSLLRAIYPVLSSYSTPDKLAYPRHSLSRAALITSGSPIFLLDAFTSLILYYAPTAPPTLPFPPPQNSLVRATINKMKQDRSITPRLVMIRGGYDNVEPFERFLIEEQDVDGGAGPSTGMGFVAFLGQVADDVREYMK